MKLYLDMCCAHCTIFNNIKVSNGLDDFSARKIMLTNIDTTAMDDEVIVITTMPTLPHPDTSTMNNVSS